MNTSIRGASPSPTPGRQTGTGDMRQYSEPLAPSDIGSGPSVNNPRLPAYLVGGGINIVSAEIHVIFLRSTLIINDV